MGLDMYLKKRTYIGAEYKHNQVKGKIEITKEGKEVPIRLERVSYIEEAVAYWRKANAIHAWFVKNVQEGKDDCNSYDVSIDDLKTLVDVCKQVLNDHDLASELLPTQEGFFFGATDYGEYYFSDLQDTISQLEPLIKEGGDFQYHSSW